MCTYAAIWPVTDPGLSVPELVAEATAQLYDMLDADNLAVLGRPVWARGAGTLVAVIRVQPDVDPHDNARPDASLEAYAAELLDRRAA